MLDSRYNHSLSKRQTGRPVLEHFVLGGRYSAQDDEWADWSTSPQVYLAQWPVQSLGWRMGRLVNQSPSISCSVVGTVPRMENGQTGQPVPKYILLGGRYSP